MRRRTLLTQLAAAAGTGLIAPSAFGARAAVDAHGAADATLLPPATAPLPPPHHVGMNHAHLHRGDRGYGSASSATQLRLLRDLGVRQVALTPFAYLPDLNGVEIRFGGGMDRTLTDDHIRREAASARALGMGVALKPHIWADAFWGGKKSRQDIRPDPAKGGWAAWFDAYTRFARHYAALAEEIDADLFVAGLEYLQATVEAPGAWAQVARSVRSVYGGQLTYAANWWREVEAFADWSAFDLIGVNAYFPLTEAADPDLPTLVDAWAPHLRTLARISQTSGRRVLFTEAGLPAVRGAAATPWDAGVKGTSDPQLQARAYEALLRAATPQPWFAGVYFWKSFTGAGNAERDPYYPLDGPAADVLKRWWAPP